MPRAARAPKASSKASTRSLRCTYREAGRRCPRDGVGNPYLCRAHRDVLEDAGQPDVKRSAMGDIVDRIATGKRVSSKTLLDGIFEIGAMFGIKKGSIPTTFPYPYPQHAQQRADQARRAGEQPDEIQSERERYVAGIIRARQTLGFAPSDPLTEDVIKAAHRKLARKHHPDRGGSVVRMQEINAAVDTLIGSLS